MIESIAKIQTSLKRFQIKIYNWNKAKNIAKIKY